MIQGLFKQMDALPPIGFLGAVLIKKTDTKPIEERMRGAGLPVRKGKVKKRGDISR